MQKLVRKNIFRLGDKREICASSRGEDGVTSHDKTYDTNL